MRKNLLFIAPNAYVLRNWITSGLADQCARYLDVTPVFASPFAEPAFAGQESQQYTNYQVASQTGNGALPAGYSRSLYSLRYLRLRAYALDLPNGGNQTRMFAAKRDFLHYVLAMKSRLMPRGSAGHRAVRGLLRHWQPGNTTVDRIVEDVQPCAIVLGTPGIHFLDEVFGIAGRKRGIPVACVVNSWDNLTSRGPMLVRPDLLMVWNRRMREYAIGLHDYPADRTMIVGALQFAQYDQPLDPRVEKAFCDRLGLKLKEPYVLYLTGAHAPTYEAEDVAALLEALQTSELKNLKVVVRVHPEAGAEAFTSLTHPNLVIDIPPRFTAGGNQGLAFDFEQTQMMAAELRGAALVVASCGTTALLEAALFDRPIVQLRWMTSIAHSRPDQIELVEAIQHYEHVQAFDAAGSRLFSYSPQDFPEMVRQAIANVDAAGQPRKSNLEDLVPRPLADAPSVTVEYLRQVLNDATASKVESTITGHAAKRS